MPVSDVALLSTYVHNAMARTRVMLALSGAFGGLALVLEQGMAMAAVGVLVGLLAAGALTRVIESLLVGVSPGTRAGAVDGSCRTPALRSSGDGFTYYRVITSSDGVHRSASPSMADLLTDLEFLVLLAVLRVGEGAYALAVQEELEEGAGRKTSVGSIYNTLVRMEERGDVESSMGEPSPTRGGKAKRLYAVTPRGVDALRRTREAMDRMWEGASIPEEAR